MAWVHLAILVVMAVILIAGLIGPLYANRRLRRWRDPTAADRRHLETIKPSLWVTPRRVVILETTGEASIEVALRGLPGYRVLFVTDYVLEELDDATAMSLLAAEAGRAKLWYREYQVIAATIAVGLGMASFGLVIPFEFGFGLLLGVAFVMLAGGRWLQYRADATAAAAVGASELAIAFETVARLRGIDLHTGGWRTYLEVQPPLGARIERLRTAER